MPNNLVALGFDAVALYAIYQLVKPYEQNLINQGKKVWDVAKEVYIFIHGEPVK